MATIDPNVPIPVATAAIGATVPAEEDPAFKALFDFLDELNGQDAYSAKDAAVGKLAKDKYLRVPTGFRPFDTPTAAIGRANARPDMTRTIYAQVYVMNKAVFDSPEEQIKGAVLRAELVRLGWYTSMYEVVEEDPPLDWALTMFNDLPQVEAFTPTASLLALVLPLAAEHTFRTMGHHFLSGMEMDYVAKYTRFFSACVMPELATFLPPAILFHRVAHWVPLAKALAVASDPAQAEHLPNAARLRASAAPAGTALITTSAAILEALAATGLRDALGTASGLRLDVIEDSAKKVKANPAAYHTIPSAYGKGPLGKADADELEAAKAESRKAAPVLQGFLDSLPRTSDLALARALGKHADVNPLLRRRAKTYFKEVGTSKAANMAELFSMDKRARAAVAEEVIDEDDE